MLKHKSVTMAGNTGQILHYEGVLEKAGKRFFEGFRKRWFILDGKNLSYYKAAETTPENLLGIIDLTKVKAVVPFKMINNNAFQIITSMRTYTFTAATPLLMTEWISVLRQAMQIEIFANKRAKNSVRQSSTKDDAGYEVVSRTSSSASEQATNEDDLYDQVQNKEDASQGSYESVGSFKRTASSSMGQQLGDYDTVTPVVKSQPPSNVPQIGTYGVIGDPGPQSPKVPDVYATVQKKRSSAPEEIPMETEDAMYAEVGNVETKQSKLPEINVMAIICESDDDEEEEEEENDDAFLEESLQDLITDPLPPPKGDSYAVEQIKLLLKDFKKDDSYKLNRENTEEITESTSVPESCEKAFTNLRDFLNQLESN